MEHRRLKPGERVVPLKPNQIALVLEEGKPMQMHIGDNIDPDAETELNSAVILAASILNNQELYLELLQHWGVQCGAQSVKQKAAGVSHFSHDESER